jgi:hypothetical protein
VLLRECGRAVVRLRVRARLQVIDATVVRTCGNVRVCATTMWCMLCLRECVCASARVWAGRCASARLRACVRVIDATVVRMCVCVRLRVSAFATMRARARACTHFTLSTPLLLCQVSHDADSDNLTVVWDTSTTPVGGWYTGTGHYTRANNSVDMRFDSFELVGESNPPDYSLIGNGTWGSDWVKRDPQVYVHPSVRTNC